MCVGGVSTTGARRLHVRLIRRSSEVDFFLCRFRLRRLLGLMMALRLVRYWHTVAGAIDNFGARCWQWGLLWLRRRYTSGSGAQRRSGRLTIADIHASQMVAFRILRECICSAGDFFLVWILQIVECCRRLTSQLEFQFESGWIVEWSLDYCRCVNDSELPPDSVHTKNIFWLKEALNGRLVGTKTKIGVLF